MARYILNLNVAKKSKQQEGGHAGNPFRAIPRVMTISFLTGGPELHLSCSPADTAFLNIYRISERVGSMSAFPIMQLQG